MSTSTNSGKIKVNRQRVKPNIFDYSYHTLRANAEVFRQFSGLVNIDNPVLDAGCGFKPWQNELPRTVNYIGVDYAAGAATPNALASVDALPFPDNTFSGILCSEVIEHTRYPEESLRELRRVCKPGGLIYISSPFVFPEHGIPYDFQRLTRFFYHSVFQQDEFVTLRPTSSTLATAFTCFNLFWAGSPFSKVPVVSHAYYAFFNMLGIIADYTINPLYARVLARFQVNTHALPLGMVMIVRVNK